MKRRRKKAEFGLIQKNKLKTTHTLDIGTVKCAI